ncbi:carbamoyltransferase HypF [Megalodesulfovibrio paquesii]
MNTASLPQRSCAEAPQVRRRLIVGGQVQGVGFRPYLYRLARAHGLVGCTLNAPEGVVVEVQGPPDAVRAFCRALVPQAPPLARITACCGEDIDPLPGEDTFLIRKSTAGKGHAVLVSPDVATCDDCLAELFDPADRRHLHPFINCTNCGPRYTITRDIPYDRPATTMACFPFCPTCRREYDDPADRRFHAQPVACSDCGPTVWLQETSDAPRLAEGDAAIRTAAEALAAGRIVAMKGLGGFHLACDARNETVVALLRTRKHRPHKPLAVMVADLAAARQLVTVSDAEAALLTALERPIVLCRLRPDARIAPSLAPGLDTLGLMLPCAPLQYVLFHHLEKMTDSTPALVMTSGNPGGEPICLGNREALERLSDMADLFLLHDRDILVRVDDSVVRVPPEDAWPVPQVMPETSCDPDTPPPPEPPRRLLFLRRARGFTPSPIQLDAHGPAAPCVLGVGPELKATLCLTKGDQAFVSQHLGDLENLETFHFFEEMAAHLQRLLRVSPVAIVHDLHPDFLTSRWARDTGARLALPVLALQHHAAHAFSVLAEHAFHGRALVLALDGTGLGAAGTGLGAAGTGLGEAGTGLGEAGTGLGEAGAVWGGEAILADTTNGDWTRLAHLRPVRLPGGEAAAREPWRMAMSYAWELGLQRPDDLPVPLPPDLQPAAAFLPQLLRTGLNSPSSSSCGRLFDALAGLLGLCHRATYEGQAAVLLEQCQDHAAAGAYPCPVLDGITPWQLDTHALFAAALEDLRRHTHVSIIARRFHRGLIAGLADLAARLSALHGVTHVGLSGGCLLNLTLHRELPAALATALAGRGLTPLLHRQLPPGDACIALGQAAWGRRQVGRMA